MIFEPFRQADRNVHSRYGGAGLGLYIVRRLLDLLEGTVALESALGEGSTFRVLLPLELSTPNLHRARRRDDTARRPATEWQGLSAGDAGDAAAELRPALNV